MSEAIWTAIRDDDLPTLLAILAADPGSAAAADGGSWPLLVAVAKKRAAMIGPLLQAAPQAAEATTDGGLTPLAWAMLCLHRDRNSAVARADVQTVRQLLAAAPAAVFTADSQGATPPERAIFSKHHHILCMMLHVAPAAAMRQSSRSGDSLLHTAALRGWPAGVQTLLKAAPAMAAAVNHKGETPLHAAAAGHSADGDAAEAVRLLLEVAPKLATAADASGRTALHLACRTSADAALLLLEAAPEVAALADSMGSTPLHVAVADSAWRLHSSGPREGGSIEQQLRAARRKHTAVAMRLLLVHRLLQLSPAAAVQQDSSGNTPVHLAAKASSREAGDGPALVLLMLVAAAPAAASIANAQGKRPIDMVSGSSSLLTKARQALQEAAKVPATQPPVAPANHKRLLRALRRLPRVASATSSSTTTAAGDATTTALLSMETIRKLTVPLPTFAAVAARLPLSEDEWQLVPGDDSCLAAALPAVLERSTDDAACLVACLPEVRCVVSVGRLLRLEVWHRRRNEAMQ